MPLRLTNIFSVNREFGVRTSHLESVTNPLKLTPVVTKRYDFFIFVAMIFSRLLRDLESSLSINLGQFWTFLSFLIFLFFCFCFYFSSFLKASFYCSLFFIITFYMFVSYPLKKFLILFF